MAAPSGEAISHLTPSLWPGACKVSTSASPKAKPRAIPEAACEVSTSDEPAFPLMADIMCGPNAPLTRGFLLAQWRTIPVDRLFGDHHDLSDTKVQAELHELFKEADFIWAALDCSTKSRCRQIPSRIPGVQLPPPLRSDEHPMGLPGLQGSDKERVTADNAAAEFVLAEIDLHQRRGGGSGRENPASSLHWSIPTEVGMMAGGTWYDQLYDACSLQGARRKRQRIRHDIDEVGQWPDMKCRHIHHPQEWNPITGSSGSVYYPSHDEAEYTACLVFHIVRAASLWACRVGRAVMRIPREPPVATVGDRTSWLRLDCRATKRMGDGTYGTSTRS